MQIINDVTVIDFLDGDPEKNYEEVLELAKSNTNKKFVISGRSNQKALVNNEYVIRLLKEVDNVTITPLLLPFIYIKNFKELPVTMITDEFMAIVGNDSNTRIERAAALFEFIKNKFDVSDVKVLNYKTLELTRNGKKEFGTLDGDANKDNIIKINYDSIINLDAEAGKLPKTTFILIGNKKKRVAPALCAESGIDFISSDEIPEFERKVLACENSISIITKVLREVLPEYRVSYVGHHCYSANGQIGFEYVFEFHSLDQTVIRPEEARYLYIKNEV